MTKACVYTPFRDAIGHATPGIFLIYLGLWLTFCIFRRYFLCLRESKTNKDDGRQFKSLVFYPLWSFPSVPILAIICLLFSLSSFIFELHTFTPMCYTSHTLIYVAFGINAIVEIFRFYKFPIPDGSDMMIGAITMFTNAMILHQHVQHSSAFTKRLHLNLTYSILASSGFSTLEIFNRKNPVISLAKAFSAVIIGCCLMNIALMDNRYLFSEHTDNHHDVMWLQLILVIQIHCVLFVIFAIGAFQYARVKRMRVEDISAALDLELDERRVDCKKRFEYLDGSSDPMIYTQLSKKPCDLFLILKRREVVKYLM